MIYYPDITLFFLLNVSSFFFFFFLSFEMKAIKTFFISFGHEKEWDLALSRSLGAFHSFLALASRIGAIICCEFLLR